MKIKNTKRISAFVLSLITCVSLPVLSEVNLGADNITFTGQASDETDAKHSRLSFRFFAQNKKDQLFQHMLKSSGTLSNLEKQFQTNFKLDAPIYFHIQHTKESQLIEAEIEATSHVVTLPYSFLYTLYQGFSTKYDQQSETIERMFAATVEFYIWSEVANIIIQNRQLEIQGKRSTAQDNFASIMMLNQNSATSDYLLDASEAYLLIHSLTSEDEDALSELESDQKRYKHILCLTIGFDQLTKLVETEHDHLEDFSLGRDQISQCQHTYLEIMFNWYEALSPSLQENNLLNYWLNQQNSDCLRSSGQEMLSAEHDL